MSAPVYGLDWTVPDCLFERFLSLTGFGSAEFGVDCHVFSVVAVVPSLVSVAP